MKRFVVLVAVLTMAAAAHAGDHGLFPPHAIKWTDGPPSLPAGAQVAVLEGDPGAPGYFTLRLKMPAGYRIPPHYHKKVEHVTVIAGTFNLGMGDRFDASKTMAMPTGTFGFLPPNMNHYAFASEPDTIIQLHGTGPWGIFYVNPNDDPRKAE